MKTAAKYLGVCPSSLGNRDQAGKLTPSRRPVDRYRPYRRADFDATFRTVGVKPLGENG